MTEVLILNASYEPIQHVSINHAIKMVVREVAVIEQSSDEMYGPFKKPLVLRLVKYVKLAWRKASPRFSKKKIFIRDDQKCAYCKKNADTIDHIIPRSKGGETSWINTVACCLKCNHKKANRTLEESGMRLLFTPYEPSWYDLT